MVASGAGKVLAFFWMVYGSLVFRYIYIYMRYHSSGWCTAASCSGRRAAPAPSESSIGAVRVIVRVASLAPAAENLEAGRLVPQDPRSTPSQPPSPPPSLFRPAAMGGAAIEAAQP